MPLRFKESEGSAVIWTLAITSLLFLAFVLTLSFAAVSAAENRATTAADLIAIHGCSFAHRLGEKNESNVISCNDDGVTVSVETRTRINLPLRVITLFAHARAQAVHEL